MQYIKEFTAARPRDVPTIWAIMEYLYICIPPCTHMKTLGKCNKLFIIWIYFIWTRRRRKRTNEQSWSIFFFALSFFTSLLVGRILYSYIYICTRNNNNACDGCNITDFHLLLFAVRCVLFLWAIDRQ